jgi:hypothetical protein
MIRLALAAAFILLPAAAMAQDAPLTAPAEPIPLFKAVCVGGSARLSRNVAEPSSYAALPPSARRALGASLAATRAEAEKLPAPDPAQVPNTIYRMAGGQTYLLVPGARTAADAPLSNSCIVLWLALSDEDYPAARRLVLPDEARPPLTARPSASALGAAVATSTGASASLTAAAFGGWVVLRSVSTNPDPQAPGAQ